MPRFRYPMDAVLRQYDWEIDALRVELMTLNQALQAKVKQVQDVTEVVAGAEREIVELCRENAIISLDRKRCVELYLRDQRERLFKLQQELKQAQALADGVFQQLNRKRQAQRAIERHRERKKKEFDTDGIRRDAFDADELWLAKMAGAQ